MLQIPTGRYDFGSLPTPPKSRGSARRGALGQDRTCPRALCSWSRLAGAELVEGDLVASTKAAPERLQVPELDRVVVTIITDNYYDALRPDAPLTKRFRMPGVSMHAEHGLSCFVETALGTSTGGFMFDYGLDGVAVSRNIELLGVDLAAVVGLGLSHGHFDHWAGLRDVLLLNRAKIRKGTPLYFGPEAFAHRYSLLPGTDKRLSIGRLDRAELEGLGLLKLTAVDGPIEVMPGGYLTGKIDRLTEYERPNPTLLVERNGQAVVDAFPGEQAMVFHLKGKGLVVLSACAHSGIVNTVRHARKITGVEKVYAVLGGFHLTNARPEVIERTVADLKAVAPEVIVPAHCTGFEATSLFAREMPGPFILNTAGTRYTFTA